MRSYHIVNQGLGQGREKVEYRFAKISKHTKHNPLSLTAWWIYNQTTLSQGDYVVVAADMNMMQ